MSRILSWRGGVIPTCTGADTLWQTPTLADIYPWQTPLRRPLQWMVRILLECILVHCLFTRIYANSWKEIRPHLTHTFFYLKFLENISPFLWGHWYPCFTLLLTSPLGWHISWLWPHNLATADLHMSWWTGCPPFSLPRLLGDGCQAHYGLGYWCYAFPPFVHIVQMVAPWDCHWLPPSNRGQQLCSHHACMPHLKFPIKEVCTASLGSLFGWLWVGTLHAPPHYL